MLCLVCNARPAPPETGLCPACDHGFHPIEEQRQVPRARIPLTFSTDDHGGLIRWGVVIHRGNV